ncbi:tkr-3 [Pristionchus pacificus]|uniref:Tkr-3 n=1 Tax=Pristionchus pacificus TaxID=54126 RepID=A0A2A6CBP0_PRIPA|nr:tkr-3 [Pristionchus pacificus]|eukprot:PDM75632.1 tkr-3 [Pristionchus pacificus]
MNGTEEEMDDGGLYVFSWIEVTLLCLLYAIIAFLGFAGNMLVVIVTLTRLRTRSITTYFIINLAIADLLTALLAIPFKFQAALFQVWHLPRSLCHVVPYVETVSLSVSVFTLTASAIHEFRTVFFPKQMRMNTNNARILVILIWLFALLVSVPHGVFHEVTEFPVGEDRTVAQCIPTVGDTSWWKIYNIYLVMIQFFIPMIILDTAYTMIACQIYSTTNQLSERSNLNGPPPQNVVANKQLMKMLMIVVLCFTLCWAPLETYLALNEVYGEVNEWRYINVFFFFSHWLAMSNSCLNPIIYWFFNAKYKREFTRIFYCLRYGRIDTDVTMKFDTELESNMVESSKQRSFNINDLPSPRSWLSPIDASSEEGSIGVPFYSETYQTMSNGTPKIQHSVSCSSKLL